MMIFEFSKGWADLVIAQLAAKHQSVCPEDWGIACVAVSEHFEDFLERNWFQIHEMTGSWVHVFTFRAPPRIFVRRKLQALMEAGRRADQGDIVVYGIISDGLEEKCREERDWEKAELLKELDGAGIRVKPGDDFIFFAFRKRGEEVEVDVLPPISTGIGKDSDETAYFKCFQDMADKAKVDWERGSSPRQFLEAVGLKWNARAAIRDATDVVTWIMNFFRRMYGGGRKPGERNGDDVGD